MNLSRQALDQHRDSRETYNEVICLRHNRIWRRTKSWGEGGYPIEREAADGSYSLFELALKQLAKYLGPTDSAR